MINGAGMSETTNGIEACDVKAIHEGVVSTVKKQMPPTNQIQSLAELYKAFGDGTRLSIVLALCEAEMCVCDLCALLNLKQSAVSHQLHKLKMSRVIKNRREGKMVFYTLADEHIREILKTGMDHITE